MADEPAAASPPASQTSSGQPPLGSYQAGRAIIDALRPDRDTTLAIRSALLQSGLSRDVCSPGTGGKARRTKLDIVDEARALFSLPPLASVDVESVRRHGEQYIARQAAMGSPVSSAAAPRERLVTDAAAGAVAATGAAAADDVSRQRLANGC